MQRRIFFAFAFVTALAPFFLPGCQAPRPTALTIETRDVMNLCPGQQTICPVAFAHGGAVVSGHVLNDLSGGPAPYGSVRSFGEFGPLFATDSDGNGAVPNARIGAQWQSTVHWNGNCGSNIDPAATASFDVTVENPVIGWGCVPIGIFGKGLGPTFVITNSPPSTMTVPSPTASLTSASGMPELRVYDQSSARVAVMFASSVSTDGTSATFPFPQLSSGLPLPQGFYTFNLWNQTSAGNFKDMGVGFFGVGSSSSATTPYGVDAADVTVSSKTCKITFPSKQIWCTLAGPTTSPSPIVTLSSGGMVSFGGATVAVGSQPTAVKGYATATQTKSTDVYGGYITTTQPSRAIVANFGSNTVSILDLFGKTVVQSISVGTEPAAVVLNSSASKAYVADYGSSSISEIDLTSNTQSRVASVGARPAALAMDPGGTAVWVGGYNYISKVDLTSFSATQTFSVSGQVTSLAVSSGQNALVYTTMATVGGSTTFQAQHVALSTGVVQATYAQYTMSSSTPYAEIVSGGPVPGAPGWLLSSSALVSANYGNSIAVVGTPTGFAVLDLPLHTDLMDGTTPSPVRGIAIDPQQGIAYLTLPDSNSILTVPLPQQHTFATGTVTISGSEQTSVWINPCRNNTYPAPTYCPQTIPYDAGTVSVIVAGAPISAQYGQGDTPSSVASNLASAINSLNSSGALGYPVTASANGSAITLTATWSGPDSNYSLLTNCASTYAQYGVGCSFSATPSAATLTGGN